MTTTLLCTAPIILGLVFIYRKIDRKFENIIIEAFKEDNYMSKGNDSILFNDVFDAELELMKSLAKMEDEIHKRKIKDKELQDYLEYRFRAESDDYAMNKEIEKIKEEYAK